jgi:hypothetical protein
MTSNLGRVSRVLEGYILQLSNSRAHRSTTNTRQAELQASGLLITKMASQPAKAPVRAASTA